MVKQEIGSVKGEYSQRTYLTKKLALAILLVAVAVAAVVALSMFNEPEMVTTTTPSEGHGAATEPTYSTEEQAILALRNSDASYCDVFSNSERKNVCLGDYYFTKALKERNTEDCKLIPLDPASEACSAVIEEDLNACNGIGGNWKDICMNFINNDALTAIEEGDQAFCDKMGGVEDFSASYCKLVISSISS